MSRSGGRAGAARARHGQSFVVANSEHLPHVYFFTAHYDGSGNGTMMMSSSEHSPGPVALAEPADRRASSKLPSAGSPGLRTKVVRPRLPADYVARPRLLRLLDRGLERRLTLISAPGGFGKTTLLSAWHPPGHAVAWLALDAGDADLSTFVRALIGALQTTTPEVGLATLSLLQLADLPSAEILAARLADDLVELPHGIVVVLDDYHTVHSDEIHAFLARFLARFTDNVHLVVSAREDPPLPISTLRARDDVVEIARSSSRSLPRRPAPSSTTSSRRRPTTPTSTRSRSGPRAGRPACAWPRWQ